MIQDIDHIALGVRDVDERIAFFTGTLGMQLKRVGTQFGTGSRIAFLADSSGFKIELIETGSDQPALLHLAYRADNVEEEHGRLVSAGCTSIRGPHELAAAMATTALLQDPSRLQIQLVRYAPDSPDL
jgi:catechol 2,3-dioxygenase-like lactoylglutathione lyase family enzyme